MTLDQYLDNLTKRYKLGNATEHTFRGDLQNLIESLVPEIRATNEPKRQMCGAPDYILTKKDIPVGFIEAKDIGDKDLDGAKKTGNKEQFDRYKASLHNLMFTDYLNFHLYHDGEFVTKIALAEIHNGTIVPRPENFASFTNLLKDFCSHIGQTIKSSKKLAEMMAGKARLLSEVIERALTSDETNREDSTLKDQMNAFKQILIHDITPKAFADVYAQTIAYGMFAARLHDPTLPTFSRQEAAELIPKSNPFLRKLFGYIAGPDIDDRIKWIVDGLVEIFLACNVEEILKNYGRSTKMEDPIIHFYETFLSEYDPKLRKARGVWYTPQPVVSFIVRAVDDILKTEFDLPQGLADTSKTTIKVNLQGNDKRFKDNIRTIDQEVHRVQILDPATGTGTFLAEAVKLIHRKFEGQQGIWSNYVENQLLPRLNGFELLMASYAMAHLKLDLLLTETGYKPTRDQRFRIYLTNSLEEHHPDTGTLFANWLSSEANEANHIKRDTPVMVVMGNPPYSGESANKGEWISSLMEDYKKEPGGKEKLKEKNSKWLNDDYCKFIRYAQHFVEKNSKGIVAFINPHGFLDAPTFRGMRWNLMNTFDKIFILDLHGNSRKKEVSEDGSSDENVFDIIQGVSINIFVKTGDKNKGKLASVNHFDLYGKRQDKYDFISQNSIGSVAWQLLPCNAPEYFFVNNDYALKDEYEKGFSVAKLIPVNGVGICSKRDSIAFQINKKELRNILEDFNSLNETELKSKYSLHDSQDAKVIDAIGCIKEYGILDKYIKLALYRPFENKWTYYTDKSHGFLARPAFFAQKHFLNEIPNIGLCLVKSGRNADNQNFFVTNKIVTKDAISSLDSINVFPLYLYPESSAQQTIEPTAARMPNLNTEIVKQIAERLGLGFVAEKETEGNVCFVNSPEIRDDFKTTFAPIDLLDYIYAVLHSPSYRKKYKEFLKIDFPRVPYPKDAETFWQLVRLGGQIRQIHLLESPIVEKYMTQYPVDGNNLVGKIKFEVGKVFINETQYFANVPEVAWNFYIGGYQPAQKWLKDRKDRNLEFEDILHYQKIIVALTETDRLMKEIDAIEIE